MFRKQVFKTLFYCEFTSTSIFGSSKYSGIYRRKGCFELYKIKSRYFCCKVSSSRTGFDDYEKERKRFDFTVPEKFNFASDVLDVWAEKEKLNHRNSAIPAFWFVYEDGKQLKWSFNELAEKSKRTANIFEQKCDLKKGDTLMVLLPKIPEFWLVNIGAIRTGVILSPGSMQLTAKDLKYRFQSFKPKCVIAEESIANAVDEATESGTSIETKILVSSKGKQRDGWKNFHQLYEETSSIHQCVSTYSNDSMMIFFTSGTTGFPKMVEHTYASYGIGLSHTGRYFLDLTEENIIWNLSDTGWAKTAYSNIFAPWSMGACVFIHQMIKFRPSLVIEILSKFPIDTLCAAPTIYRMLVQENLSNVHFPHLEHCVSGGEPLNPEVIRLWMKATGQKIYEGYGQTETVMLLGMFKCLTYKAGSIGKPPPGTDIVILDEHNRELGPNKEGEVAVKTKPISPIGLFKGYKNDPEKTQSRFTDTYFRTGDMAYYGDDGYFWFVGRKDDIINSAGYRIGPSEVESALIEHPSVVEAAVVSSPDEVRGEVVKAFVVLTNDYSSNDKVQLSEDLQNYVKSVTAPYKYPRKIEFVKELPKTVSGKIKRFELKNKEWREKTVDKNILICK